MPPHGYIHVLSLTDNIADFKNAVNKQKISGNIDTPEGGFDAMLQAAVCQVRRLLNWQFRYKFIFVSQWYLSVSDVQPYDVVTAPTVVFLPDKSIFSLFNH